MTRIRRVFLVAGALGVMFQTLSAQNLDEAFREGYGAFTQEDYDQALLLLRRSNAPQADLFAGMAAFMSDKCSEALPLLASAAVKASDDIAPGVGGSAQLRDHALFTEAQCLIRLRRHSDALVRLERLSREAASPQMRADASNMHSRLAAFLSDGPLPPGFVHVIDVVLPWTSEDPVVFQASKSLYQGLLLAIEDVNEALGTHVRLRLVDSNPQTVTPDSLLRRLRSDDPADLIIGPLFSSTVESIMGSIRALRAPVITPLANSDEVLNSDSGIIQMNPPFSVQGRAMARHAMESLGLRTFGIIADRPTLGYAAAVAFKEEAERLGGSVSIFYAEDLAETGYDITPFTAWLETDPIKAESQGGMPIEAVYAPFTGQQAQTMIQLLLTEIEAKRSRVVVLGTEEWDSDLTRNLMPRATRVHHTSQFNPSPDPMRAADVEESFLQKYGEASSDLAWVGYEVGTFIGGLLERQPNPGIWNETLRSMPPHEGIKLRFDLQGGRVNRHVHIKPLSSKGVGGF